MQLEIRSNLFFTKALFLIYKPSTALCFIANNSLWLSKFSSPFSVIEKGCRLHNTGYVIFEFIYCLEKKTRESTCSLDLFQIPQKGQFNLNLKFWTDKMITLELI